MTHPEDTATIERDLRAVDAALAAGAAEHGDPQARELQELALALRADAPRPRPGFAEELRARAEAGFPRKPRTAWRPRRLRPFLAPSAVTLTVVALIGVAIATSEDPGTSDDGASGGGGIALDEGAGRSSSPEAATGAAPDAGTARGGGDDAAVVPSQPLPRDGGFAPGQGNRKIERSIAMTLEAPEDQVAEVADGVTRTTGRYGGFVLRSDLNTGEDGASGTFELRIPSARLQAAVRDLSALATVRSQTQSGQDVTREHVTTKDRLQSARAERRSLLRRLENADTDEEAESIRRRLDLVAGEINGLRAQLRDLRLRTDYAVVTVDLVSEDGESGSGAGAGSFDDALGDAGDLLVGTAGVLIRILALAVPLGAIAGAAWVGARTVRRRRRESALA
jgi:hypothetical protein